MTADALGAAGSGRVGPSASPAPLRGSALIRAARVMWATAPVALGAIAANAAAQGALTYLDTPSGLSPAFLIAFVVSAAIALGTYGVLTAAALTSAQGLGRAVLDRLRAGWPAFVVWALAQWLVMLAVSLVSVYLILPVAVLTPFLPLAAMAGQRHALRTNFVTIRASLGRWLLTSLALSALAVLLYLLAVANTLFVHGTWAAVFFWLVTGVLAWWVLTAWALIRASAPEASTTR